MPTATVNGCEFHYEMRGEGLPIVFIHGESHSRRLFDAQIEHFSRTHRCFAYDRRGHASSGLPSYGYSMWHNTVDLKALLDHLQFDQVVLVGVAMSTPIAATFAIENPERVKGLVLCSWYELDGYPILEERRRNYKHSLAEAHLIMRDFLVERGRAALEAYFEERHLTEFPIFPPDKPEVRRKLIEIFAGHEPEHYVKSAEYYTSLPNVRSRLGEVRCPILGICGADDPSPDRPELLSGMPNFRQVWIEGARRFTMMEYPDAFNAELEAFLAQVH